MSGEIDGKQSTLFKRFSSLSVTFDEDDFSGQYAWVNAIGNVDLSAKLARLHVKDIELLTAIVIEGRGQRELAEKWHCSQSAISQRLKKIKEFLK